MTLHDMAWHNITIQYNAIRYNSIQQSSQHYKPLQYLTTYGNTLHCIHYTHTLNYVALRCITCDFITFTFLLHFITCHYITLLHTDNYSYPSANTLCFRWAICSYLQLPRPQERMMNDCSSVEDALQLLQSTPSVSPAFSVPRTPRTLVVGFSCVGNTHCQEHLQLTGQ